MSARAVSAVRRWNAVLAPDATYVLVSHGDVIKAILADALGLHLDFFQRIGVEPAALSVVRYGATGTDVERVNDTGGGVDALVPRGGRARRRSPASSSTAARRRAR
jgi:broad specificity phosphatase PhoE